MRMIHLVPLASGLLCSTAARADDLTISPRGWLLVDSLASGDQPAVNANVVASFSSPSFVVPMAGASVAYRSDSVLPRTVFTFTALFGEDTKILTTRGGEVRSGTLPNGTNFQQIIFSLQQTPERLRRRDFELTAQTRINDFLSWAVGVRYERARVRFSPVVTVSSTNPFTGLVDTTVQKDPSFIAGYDLFSVRGGIAFVAPLNEVNRDLVYANGLVFLGRRVKRGAGSAPQYADATFLGPDFTVGYTHRFGKNISLDARYRGLFFFPITGPNGTREPKVTHGPNVGINYHF